LRSPLKFHRDRPIEPGEAIDPGGQKDAADRRHQELDMGLDVARIESTSFSTAPERAPRASRAADADGIDDTFVVSSGDIPASPPPEVLEAMDAAGRVARELHATGRELHFVPPADGAGGRVHVEVRDLDGNVLRTIPPSELLDLATGAPLD
jgi:flagellar protein FlaG